MHFHPCGLPFLKRRPLLKKSGPLLKKSHITFFQKQAAQKKKWPAGEIA